MHFLGPGYNVSLYHVTCLTPITITLWRGVNVWSYTIFVQEDLPDVENAIFQSVIQESLHDIGGEMETYQPEPSDEIRRCIHV